MSVDDFVLLLLRQQHILVPRTRSMAFLRQNLHTKNKTYNTLL